MTADAVRQPRGRGLAEAGAARSAVDALDLPANVTARSDPPRPPCTRDAETFREHASARYVAAGVERCSACEATA